MAQIRPDQLLTTLTKRMDKSKKNAVKSWQKKAKKVIKKEMISDISKGLSPVAGQGRFKKYTTAYRKVNKSVVNLKVSGKMLKSLAVKNTIKGISVFFTSGIMKYHNGQGRVDRLTLPVKSGQKFRLAIRKELAALYKGVFKI